jgi:hypothetical protein
MEGNNLEDQGANGRNYITIDIREAGLEGVDWTSGGSL